MFQSSGLEVQLHLTLGQAVVAPLQLVADFSCRILKRIQESNTIGKMLQTMNVQH